MVSMSSIVILEGREWGPLREIRLDEPGTENLKNFAEQTKWSLNRRLAKVRI